MSASDVRRACGVISFAVLMAIVVGAIALVVRTFVDEPREIVVYSLTTLRGLRDLFALLLLVIVPASLPMALVGGVLAAFILHRERAHRSLSSWTLWGATWAFVLGGLGSGLWFGAINLGEPESLSFVMLMSVIGAFAGCLVGAAVGAYCWRAARAMPPNKWMQLTGEAQATDARS